MCKSKFKMLVDETGLDEPRVDKTAVDEIAVYKPGPNLLAYLLYHSKQSLMDPSDHSIYQKVPSMQKCMSFHQK